MGFYYLHWLHYSILIWAFNVKSSIQTADLQFTLIKRQIASLIDNQNMLYEEIQNSNSDDMYVLVQWPDIQEYMDKEGFRENACLANDEHFVDTYGSSAYFVDLNWLEANTNYPKK